MAKRDYLPLILFSAILSALCTFAHKRIDYQQIVLCIQVQRASALRLHPSAPYLHPSARVSTATIPHTPHDKNWRASRTLRHRGSGFSVRATDFSASLHIFFLTGTNDMTPPAQARVQMAVQTKFASVYTTFHTDNQSIIRH